MNINPKLIKYLRPGVAVVVIVLGLGFMMVPFIPIGYILIFAGLFLIMPYIPFVKKWIDYLKKKDDKNILDKTEKNINGKEQKLRDKLTQ
jgi:uncharacterized membrane protein